MMFGAACIGYKEHQSLLDYCDHVTKILVRVNSFILMLTPVGIFGIAASAAGTLTLGHCCQCCRNFDSGRIRASSGLCAHASGFCGTGYDDSHAITHC